MNYTEEIHPGEMDMVMTVEEFKDRVRDDEYTDQDGCGWPVKDGKYAICRIFPSELEDIPEDATHIFWLNR